MKKYDSKWYNNWKLVVFGFSAHTAMWKSTLPVGKIAKSLKECVFFNSALKVQCHIVKNTLV